MSAPDRTARAPSVVPILVVNFVGTLGYSIVLPFLVFLVTRLGGNAVVYGVIGATYSAFQLLGAPVLGRWSDRIGRKKVLLVSQLGTFLSWGIFLVAFMLPLDPLLSVDAPVVGRFALTAPLVVLFLARALDGLTGGNVSVANAYLADITTEEQRSTNFGRLTVSANLGYVLGPALAGVLGATAAGEKLPVVAAFAISGVATLVILLTLRDWSPCVLRQKPEVLSVRDTLGGDQKECYRIRSERELSTRQILALPSIALLLALQGLVFLAFNFYYVAFPVHAATGLGWDVGRVGIYFAVLSVLMALVQGPLLARLSQQVTNRHLIVGGSVALAAGFALFLSASTTVVYAGTALMAIGNGLMWPSLLAVLSRSTGRELQGAVQGLAGSLTSLASIVGLLLGGPLFEWLGPHVFLLSAGVTLLVAGLSLWIDRGAGNAPETAVEPA